MNNKLNIINFESTNPDKIFITENGLSYISSKENNKQVNIVGEDSDYRPLRCSELYKKLELRDWNITGRRYISTATDEKDMLKIKIRESIDPIDSINCSESLSGFSASTTGISEEDKNIFNEKYKDILENMTSEVYIYNSSKNTVDLINNSVVVNVIGYDSDIYTNTLNLSGLLNSVAYPGISGKIDLTIQYCSKNNIVNYDTTFEAFKFDKGQAENNNFIKIINSEVTLEYTNRTIKVLPNSNGINECIIRNCTITYGNLN